MAFTREYRTKIHEALLVRVWSKGITAPGTGFTKLDAAQLDKIVSSKDKQTVKDADYDTIFVYKASTVEQTSQDQGSASDATQIFIKLGLLLAILNKELKKADTPFITFNLSPGDNRYKTIDGHISIDPQVALLPSTLQGLLDGQESFDKPLVYDIWLNINMVTRVLDDHISRTADVALLDFFDMMLSEIERVTGGINKYELQYFEETASFTVVDRNRLDTVPSSKFPVISIFGLNSTVKSLNLVSKISPKMSSMVAISAQASPFTTNMESTGFNALNRDLEQGVIDTITDDSTTVGTTSIESAETTYQQMLDAFEKDMISIFAHVNAIYGPAPVLNLTDAYTVSSLYQNYCNMVLGKKDDPAYGFIIPFELNLTLHGISGVRVLESFKIDKSIIPSTYGGTRGTDIAFVITGVEHQVNRGQWVTNIKSQIYNVNSTGTVNGGKDYQKFWKLGVTAPGSAGGGTGGSGIQGDRYKGTTKRSIAETTTFVTDVLKGIGIPSPNAYQIKFAEAWRQKEGAQAAWNPFNTTLKVQDSLRYNIISETIGVQNYPNRQAGLDATIKTLNSRYYTDLVTAIKAIKDDATANAALQALHNSPWGTKFNPFPAAANVSKLGLTDPIWGDPIVKR